MRRPEEPLTLTTSLFALCPVTFRVPVGKYELHCYMCVCACRIMWVYTLILCMHVQPCVNVHVQLSIWPCLVDCLYIYMYM